MSAPAAQPATAALRHRDFRAYVTALVTSRLGTSMQAATLLWHVTEVAPEGWRAEALGGIALARVLPTIGFAVLGGVAADRVDRRRLLVATQLLLALPPAVLALWSFVGLSTVWPFFALSFLAATFEAFDFPARHVMLASLVPPPDLRSAVSLVALGNRTAVVAGPLLAGLALATLPRWVVYAANALSFLVVVRAVLSVRELVLPPSGPARPERASEGLRFLFGHAVLRGAVLLDFAASFFASATVLLPVIAQDVLHVGPAAYGWLRAATPIGAWLASLAVVRFGAHVERTGRVLLVVGVTYGLGTVAFGLATTVGLAFLALVGVGAADTVGTVLRSVLRQEETPHDLRGRAIGLQMIFFRGGPQLGNLEAAAVASAFGAVVSVVSGGLGAALAALVIGALTPELRAYRSSPPRG